MAEIKIEPKAPVWPWLLLALAVIALLLYFLVFRAKKEPVADAPVVPALIDVHENNSTVSDYVNFIGADTSTMTLDHAYSSKALLMLVDATRAMAGEIGFGVKGDLDRAKECADAITVDPLVTTHADSIRKAADILSGVLHNMQEARYPTLVTEAAEVSTAAAAVNPQTLTLDQREAVKKFFRKAAALLQKMN